MPEWDRNPLLREEVAKGRVKQSTLAPVYRWVEGGGLAMVTWRGHDVGTVWENGSYRLSWRGHVHAGKAASQRQAIRYMTRWLVARGTQSPFRPSDEPRSKGAGSLADFIRDYQDGEF